MTNEDTAILVVDDEFSVRDSLSSWFRKEGYRVGVAANANEALASLQEAAWDLILLDIRMPGMDGLELQRRIRKLNPDIAIIIITAYASVDTAVQALKEGAFDYVTKPIDPDELNHLVRNAAEKQRLRAENDRLRANIDGLAGDAEIVGESPQMKAVLELTSRASQTDAAVLIRGRGGTGKEHVARVIHANSRRRYFPIVPLSCGAFSEDLLEEELLGHQGGTLPAAQYPRKGKFEMADGGTLFLDEIDRISLNTQATLSSVLDSKEFTRLGGLKSVRSDFRLICATDQDLGQLVEKGSFREDFHYRINVITIDLPPLAERRSDIPLLARHFLRKYAQQVNRNITDFEPAAMDLLLRQDWPGNVRELANAIERAVVVGRETVLRIGDLPLGASHAAAAPGEETLAAIERTHILRTLDRAGRDLARAAEILGIDQEALRAKIERYGLQE